MITLRTYYSVKGEGDNQKAKISMIAAMAGYKQKKGKRDSSARNYISQLTLQLSNTM